MSCAYYPLPLALSRPLAHTPKSFLIFNPTQPVLSPFTSSRSLIIHSHTTHSRIRSLVLTQLPHTHSQLLTLLSSHLSPQSPTPEVNNEPENSLIYQSRQAHYHPGVKDVDHLRNILVNADGFRLAWYSTLVKSCCLMPKEQCRFEEQITPILCRSCCC
jgi:hypothetical protein